MNPASSEAGKVSGWSQKADSRLYVYAFLMRSAEDLPADFPVPETADGLRLGLFLPRWEGGSRRAKPSGARILALCRDRLVIRFHPREEERPLCLPLQDLVFLELGRFLLRGWLRVVWNAGEMTLPYHARYSDPLDQFLLAFREAWLGTRATVDGRASRSLGPPPDLKYQAEEAAELGSGERALLRFFNPPALRIARRVLRRRSWSPGDLLTLTQQRILWITDRWGGHHASYGVSKSYAPLDLVRHLTVVRYGKPPVLVVAFRGQAQWAIPLPTPESLERAERFVEHHSALWRGNAS